MSAEDDRPADDGADRQQHDTDQQHPPRQQRDPNRRAAPTEQRRPPRRESAMESLSRPNARNQLKYTIGLFAEIGIGFGLTGFVVIELLATGGDFVTQFSSAKFVGYLLSLIILGIMLVIGPVIAAFSGIRVAEGLREEDRTVYLTSAVGNFVGYFLMMVIVVLLITATGGGVTPSTITGSSGASIFDLGKLLVPMVALAIPVALVGAGTAYLHLNVGTDR